MENKAYRWSGAVDNKFSVKPIKIGGNELINFAVKKSSTYRDDMGATSYNFYSDTNFDVYITDRNNTIAHLHASETIKYWHSTPEDAINMARACINGSAINNYYIYKTADNLYEIFTKEIQNKSELVEIVKK